MQKHLISVNNVSIENFSHPGDHFQMASVLVPLTNLVGCQVSREVHSPHHFRGFPTFIMLMSSVNSTIIIITDCRIMLGRGSGINKSRAFQGFAVRLCCSIQYVGMSGWFLTCLAELSSLRQLIYSLELLTLYSIKFYVNW